MSELWEIEEIENEPRDFTYTVDLGNQNIQVSSDSEEMIEYASRDFPEGEDPEAVLNYQIGEEYNPRFDPESLVVQAKGPEDYGLMRSVLLGLHGWREEEIGNYPCHGSVITKNESGIALVGSSGSGKSLYTFMQGLEDKGGIVNDDWTYMRGERSTTVTAPDPRLRLDKDILLEVDDYVNQDLPVDDIDYQLEDEDGVPEALVSPQELGLNSKEEAQLDRILILDTEFDEEEPVEINPEATAEEIIAHNPHIPGVNLEGEEFGVDKVDERNERRENYWTTISASIPSFRVPVRSKGIEETNQMLSDLV